ncbi:DNA-binding protein [Paucibacter sp. KBW04]|uniref:excalibur calcium-binding domain-containing protein n=1 Tax=Paucibacter sp. KBW04 TaxID=2153361 RepID=UPI000F578918|nr:excalibur calcium-binding domain-containing protein [Paucibacter sp. KBW04]RQO59845.1 DNA-binding protein [Paucibacter sp. KBW04]
MRKFTLLVLLAAALIRLYESHKGRQEVAIKTKAAAEAMARNDGEAWGLQGPPRRSEARQARGGFDCDGRSYCSQMRSCDEAKYFLQFCPGVNLDGNKNGLPCEQQWCSP